MWNVEVNEPVCRDVQIQVSRFITQESWIPTSEEMNPWLLITSRSRRRHALLHYTTVRLSCILNKSNRERQSTYPADLEILQTQHIQADKSESIRSTTI